MAIKIKADLEEFALAIANGAVYGKVIRAIVIAVYVDLGNSEIYRPSPKDDPNAEYKKFSGCTIYYAESDEKLDKREYLNITRNCTVVIYC
jgi:hypothetical protein